MDTTISKESSQTSTFLPGPGTVDITLSIVSLNVIDDLRRCLQSVRDLKTKLSIQVIVVDNNSSDGSQDMVRQEFPEYTLIALDTNDGYSAGNNVAFNQAEGRYILILNPDTEILEGALESMVEYLDSHPQVGGAGCKLLNTDRTLQHSIHTFPTLPGIFSSLFGLDRTLFRFFPHLHAVRYDLDYDKVQDVHSVLGAVLTVPREMLRAVGPMDTRFFLYAEEIDLCHRIKLNGQQVHYIPFGSIVHYRKKSIKQIPSEWEFTHRIQSLYRFYEKHCTRSQVRMLRWIFKLRFFLQKMARSLKLLVSGNQEHRSMIDHLNELNRWLNSHKLPPD